MKTYAVSCKLPPILASVEEGRLRPGGDMADCAAFLVHSQFTDQTLWEKFVREFRNPVDGLDAGWRGEFWGKMMRSAAMIYAFCPSPVLYAAMRTSVLDIFTVQDGTGRVSSYSPETEFGGWDLWCRKYVLLGMLSFWEICEEEALVSQILAFCRGVADAVLRGIGREEGKKRITLASQSWLGLNSSSLLEPMVKLYRITGERRYLDFASYIVEEGGALGINVFALARENRLLPYQYGVSKAYEMISCFEGLLEYALVTGDEGHLSAVKNFGRAILDSETSIIGSLGITHELLDHTKVRQTVRHDGVMQETCVTVTWMKLCQRLYRVTGDTDFADAMEISFHNAYLGAFNREHRHSPYIRRKYVEGGLVPHVAETFLPFDSYSPLTPGKRGQKVAGNRLLQDGSYYGCCACIGGAGLGAMLGTLLLRQGDATVLSFYERGTYKANGLTLTVTTSYPADGEIRIGVCSPCQKPMPLWLRIPAWSEKTRLSAPWPVETKKGFLVITVPPMGQAELILSLDLSPRIQKPIPWERDTVYTDVSGSQEGWHTAKRQEVFHRAEDDGYFAVLAGPLVLGADGRLGKSPDSPFLPPASEDPAPAKSPFPARVCLSFGKEAPYLLADYASLGLDWKSMIAAWLPTDLPMAECPPGAAKEE